MIIYNKFENRRQAGKELARVLTKYRNKNVVVYGVPRGGVIIADEIAKYLHAPLDLIITRKIGHPDSPEYAIGAIAENGHNIMNTTEYVDELWLRKSMRQEQKEALRRRKLYSTDRVPISATNKIAILVDDGIATGLTIRVAILELKHQNPEKIIVATPVITEEAAYIIMKEADELITLIHPQTYFNSIGSYYMEFPQISDNEVVNIMSSYT